ncbi:TlpA disulfide reductase family protein [Noviherbaspirillum sp. UKPF54]|uniref:TlpA family protein disulfide reductase n=1 Tax=Noviherbaspirillum sp. UKPF54 TaxID=2601898 RepID=UPI0011B15220|nr:TlpA disulfide reductase family protein [Noviherbaspirillum sp. UKPF54]QDZ29615.1 TlpA family protein disulfide reductase [Noviherbaspirillum sp. UKPF54]
MMKRLVLMTALLALSTLAGAADFSFTDTRGQQHSLAGHAGKWVLVNLWATWCAPCLSEMPELEALSKARKELVVLGLAVDGQSAQRVAQFAGKLGVTYPVVAGDAAMAQQFGARGFPISILYNASGQQVMVKEGVITRQQIESILDREK